MNALLSFSNLRNSTVGMAAHKLYTTTAFRGRYIVCGLVLISFVYAIGVAILRSFKSNHNSSNHPIRKTSDQVIEVIDLTKKEKKHDNFLNGPLNSLSKEQIIPPIQEDEREEILKQADFTLENIKKNIEINNDNLLSEPAISLSEVQPSFIQEENQTEEREEISSDNACGEVVEQNFIQSIWPGIVTVRSSVGGNQDFIKDERRAKWCINQKDKDSFFQEGVMTFTDCYYYNQNDFNVGPVFRYQSNSNQAGFWVYNQERWMAIAPLSNDWARGFEWDWKYPSGLLEKEPTDIGDDENKLSDVESMKLFDPIITTRIRTNSFDISPQMHYLISEKNPMLLYGEMRENLRKRGGDIYCYERQGIQDFNFMVEIEGYSSALRIVRELRIYRTNETEEFYILWKNKKDVPCFLKIKEFKKYEP